MGNIRRLVTCPVVRIGRVCYPFWDNGDQVAGNCSKQRRCRIRLILSDTKPAQGFSVPTPLKSDDRGDGVNLLKVHVPPDNAVLVRPSRRRQRGDRRRCGRRKDRLQCHAEVLVEERARLQFVDEVHSQSVHDYHHQLGCVDKLVTDSSGILTNHKTRHARPVENRCREIDNVGYIEPRTQQGVRVERGEETGNVTGGCRCLFGHCFAKSAMSLRKKEPSNVVLSTAVYARSRASL